MNERKNNETQNTNENWYKNKVILAPMVRIGTFPMRLLSVKYGADIVYNQELIDYKVRKLKRIFNTQLNCIDFMDVDHQNPEKQRKKLIFRTFPNEPIVFQIGTNDAVRCLQACNVISKDVKGIDVNMGCPKKFSICGGMGAALLKCPELVEDILKTMKRNISLPITCKIRCLQSTLDSNGNEINSSSSSIKNTVEFCQRLEKCGISAIAIHARYTCDRPRNMARIHLIKPIVEQLHIPCIYNGDIFQYSEIAIAKQMTGCSSVMIARGAQWNASVFDGNGLQPLWKVIDQYIDISEKYGNIYSNSKYAMVKMMCSQKYLAKSNVIQKFIQSYDWKQARIANQALKELISNMNECPSVNYQEHSIFDTF